MGHLVSLNDECTGLILDGGVEERLQLVDELRRQELLCLGLAAKYEAGALLLHLYSATVL